jgi:hypothetical protein
VSEGYDPTRLPRDQWPPFTQFAALWDTGATCCVISQKVIDTCLLKTTGFEPVSGVYGDSIAETMVVNIGLPNGIAFSNLTVVKGKCGGADLIVGMDIITMGDFSITNQNGQTLFSFRFPSQHTVDYVKDLNRQKASGAYGKPAVNPASRKR